MRRSPSALGNRPKRRPAALPSASDVAAFIRSHPAPAGAREIARAFDLGPAERPALRAMLRRIERSGAVTRTPARRLTAGQTLPEIAVIERIGSDEDGTPLATPVAWSGPAPAPLVRIDSEGGDGFPIGARASARLVTRDDGEIEAHIVRRLDPDGARIVGVVERDRQGVRIVSADRRNRTEYTIREPDTGGAGPGELVVAEIRPTPRFGAPRARIVERLGFASDPGAVSRLAIATFDIPSEFPAAALAEAEAATPPGPEGRIDLRDLSLVTIDGSDARDFDDAVWAEPDPDPANRGGWHLVVAIADVALYVTAGSALDREAARRGNSVYFPDRVVPMLPEALSNYLCSLVPAADRPCLAAHLWIDADGRKRRHRFERALMRSAARLTYDAVQAAHDGQVAEPFPLAADRLAALYGAFAALDRARRARGALDLDLAEHRVVLDGERRPIAVVPRTRLDSHRLIEEFMILANVAAAEELEARRRPCVYRVHDAPDPERLDGLRQTLIDLGVPGLALAKGQALRPELFNRILERAAGRPEAAMINDLVLRAQAQAAYSPHNIGHFGLALRRYAHFTSPIRRYADLLVHRALLSEPVATGEELAAIAEHISSTERRATAAERAALDRYRVRLCSGMIGQVFSARVSGVVRFGLFVRIADSGTDGLIPLSNLPVGPYRFDPKRQRLTARHNRRGFGLGDAVTVRLVEADPIGGRLVFTLEIEGTRPSPKSSSKPPTRRRAPSRRRRR